MHLQCKKNYSKIIKYAIILICVFTLVTTTVSAAPYKGYSFDLWNEAVPSQVGYLPEMVLMGKDFGEEIGRLLEPKDLYVTDDEIFILDSGNGRVIILDHDMRAVRVIKEFIYNGTSLDIKAAMGIFVHNELMYIADTANNRVVVSNREGAVRLILTKPETDMLDEEFVFQPQKVLVDNAGMIYVTASGFEKGSMLFTPQGEFSGFFGSNTVEVTATLILDRFWKKILPQTATEGISNYVPEEIRSFCIDDRNFIYTVTQSSDAKQKVKKLNFMGENILVEEDFGELEETVINGKDTASRFIDIAVDDRSNIVVLDQQTNRIYQYDREGSLLFIFGGTGMQSGTFSSAVALETLGDKVLVLDSKKHNLTVFNPTSFGNMVHEAVDIYNAGRYSEATEIWKDVLSIDQNYLTGYVSIGKALFADKQYKEAAEYFRLGNDRAGNSDAFEAYRNELLQKYFPVVFLIVLIFIFVIVLLLGKKKKKEKKNTNQSLFRFLLHPTEAAEEMKYYKTGSFFKATVILLLWFIAVILNFGVKGFRFNTNNIDEMNVFLLFIQTVPLFAVWVMANWGVTTLMNGKGNMKEIYITNAYSLIPYIASIYINIGLSWVLVDSEEMFMVIVSIIGILWSICTLFGVLMGIHEYGVGQTIAAVFLTIIGVLVVVFLIVMVFSMVQQAYGFVYSIFNELLYRFK